MAKLDIKKSSDKELDAALASVNGHRAELTLAARAITAEQRLRRARAKIAAELAKLSPEQREAMKNAL